MRFRRLAIASAGFAAAAALAACGNTVPQVVKDAGYETARTTLEAQLTGFGFTNVVVTVEDETDKVGVKGKPPVSPTSTSKTGRPATSTSATPRNPRSKPAAKTTAKTVYSKILSATFDIPGLACRGNVEQQLEPEPGVPYFDEVILPDGTEVEVAGNARADITLGTVFNYVYTFPQCQAGVIAPPVPTTTS